MNRLPFPTDSSVNHDLNIVEKQINFIKNTFSLTDEKLAGILGVERKTVHNWVKNNNISREGSRQKFFDLYVLAKDWLSLGYPTDKTKIVSVMSDELSFFDALASFDKEKVLFIGRHLQRQFEDESDLI